jgi:hypothetical protein
MLSALRSGTFVTRERVRVYSALLLVAYLAAIAGLLVTADGLLDAAGRPLGTDFANVYSAGQMVREGKAALAYDWPAHHAAQQALFGRPDVPFYGMHYPPAFLFVALLLAGLPYLLALFAYQAATLAACVSVVRRIAGRADAWLPALAFPAVFVNVTHGHNGFLTAALIGGALLALDRRPLLAGVLIGCLSYKPQLGVLIPLVLAVTGRWRAFAAAGATVLALAGLSWVAFGSEVWVAFRQSLMLTQRTILEDGTTGFFKMQSVFAALRLIGAPLSVAYAAQAVTTIGLAGAIVVLWRSAAAFELKAAGLLIASLLATPYVMDYDLVVLAPAIAFLSAHGAREGFAPWEMLAMAALFVLPLAARPLAAATFVPLGPVVMLAAFALVCRRADVLGALNAARLPAWSRRVGL